MRTAFIVSLVLALAACNKGMQNKDAVKQGVLDYLASRPNLSMGGMTVEVSAVTFKDNQAEATVTFAPKGGPAGSGMTMRYTLEQKDNKWSVVNKADSGKSPHGGAGGAQAMPDGMPNPHGGGMPGGAGMPSGVDTEKPPAPSEKK